MAARVPAAAHRQHVAAGQRQPAGQELALAAALLLVVELERPLVGEAVEQVVGVVWLAHSAASTAASISLATASSAKAVTRSCPRRASSARSSPSRTARS